MSENKNIASSLTTRERLGVGVGAALVGAMVISGVTSANEIGSVDTSYASELPSHDLSASPSNIHLEPRGSAEQIAAQTPSFKGKATITKKGQNHKHSSPNTTTQELSKSVITPEAQQVMDDNSAYIYALGCSGFLIRNPVTNNPVGVVTAEHCALLDNTSIWGTPRSVGSDGKTYAIFGTPLEVDTGKFAKTTEKVGTIREIYVPTSKENTVDIAIAAFDGNTADEAGHTVQEVLAYYNANKLSDDEINKLKLGDQAFLSGWPEIQPKTIGAPERQDFPLTILGVEKGLKVADGKVENILWTVAPFSPDGSGCTWGNSGGQGFIMIDGKPRSIGVLSAFIPLDNTFNEAGGFTKDDITTWKNKYQDRFKMKLTGTLCGFNYTTPDEINSGTNLEIVNSYSEIPIRHDSIKPEIPASAEPLIQKAHDEFFDPNYVKTWVRGAINLDPNGKGNWKMNPVIFYDKESGGAVLATYTDNAKDGVELDYLPDFKDQKFNGYPELINETGVIDVFSNQGGSGFINNSGGQIFGLSENNPNAIKIIQESPSFSLYFDDSTQSLQIMQYKHN